MTISIALAVYIVMQLIDGWQTIRSLMRGNVELNPVVAKAIDWVDITPGVMITKAISIAAGLWLWVEGYTAVLVALCVFYLPVLLLNFITLRGSNAHKTH